MNEAKMDNEGMNAEGVCESRTKIKTFNEKKVMKEYLEEWFNELMKKKWWDKTVVMRSKPHGWI